MCKIITCKVKINAKRDFISACSLIEDKYYLIIHTKAKPLEQAANYAVIKILAKAFHLKQKEVEIISGQKCKLKIIKLHDISEQKFHETVTKCFAPY